MRNRPLFLLAIVVMCAPLSAHAGDVEVNWDMLDAPIPVAAPASQKAVPVINSQLRIVEPTGAVRAQDSLQYLKDKYFPEGYSYSDTGFAPSQPSMPVKTTPAPVVKVLRNIPVPVIRPAYAVNDSVVSDSVPEAVVPVVEIETQVVPSEAVPDVVVETVAVPDQGDLIDAGAAALAPAVIAEPVADLTSGGSTSFASDDRGLLVHAFTFGREDIRLSDLDRAALVSDYIAMLNQHDDARVSIYAYADSDGRGKKKARRLSLSRALEFRSQLVADGVSSARIDIFPLGDAVEDGPRERIDLVLQK